MRYKIPGMRLKLLGPHVTTALQVWLWLLLFVFQNEFRISKSSVPGYLDFDNLPDTNFSCTGKVIGGYYADVETSCQMFHVCTIGQQDEPMDIKFLCLNGTVFDQETRVCERVDEVDCSKSEKFYSLNLELYGNTAPPIVEDDEKDEEIEDADESDYDDTEVSFIETSTITTQQPITTSIDYTTTTKQITTQKQYTTSMYISPTSSAYEHDDDFENMKEEYYLEDHQVPQNQEFHRMKEEYLMEHKSSPQPFHTEHSAVNNRDRETNSMAQNTKYNNPETSLSYHKHHHHHHNPSKHPNNPEHPHVFIPTEFINQQKLSDDQSQKTEAISFQHQVFPNTGHNPQVTVTTHNNEENNKNENTMANDQNEASKIYITTSTPQIDQRKPESFHLNMPPKILPMQHNIPTTRPALTHPRPNNPIVHYNYRNPPLIPQGFRPSQPTQNPPPSQIQSPNQGTRGQNKFATQRPIQSYQPSEHHEIHIDSSFKLPEGPPLGQHDYPPYHLEHSKRSHDQILTGAATEDDSKLITAFTDHEHEEWFPRRHVPKSPPKVIITASASVSDSNGKKLNYTVGNLVHAVPPNFPVNYDDYKESDVILDPFFLDVPKLKRKRSKRNANSKRGKVSKRSIMVESNSKSQNLTKMKIVAQKEHDPNSNSTSTVLMPLASNSENYGKNFSYNMQSHNKSDTPPDYVDDNYEPITFKEGSTKKVEIKSPLDIAEKYKASPVFTKEKKKENEAYIREMEKKLFTEALTIHKNTQKFLQIDKVLPSDKHDEFKKFSIPTIQPYSTNQNVSLASNNYSTVNSVNYSLIKVKIEVLVNSVHDNDSLDILSCRNRTFHKFYIRNNDCSIFHLCTPGYNKGQVLNLIYQCDVATYFDLETTKCTDKKPSECKV